VDDYLDFVTNRTVPDLSAELQPALEALWSSEAMAAVMGTDETTDNLTCSATVACDVNVPLNFNPELLREHFFMVQAHGFMDEHTFDLKRVMKCCIHELLPSEADGRAVPFCAYNNLGYRVGGVSRRREREQARAMTDTTKDREIMGQVARCATFYQSDVVRMLLGDVFHPGGLALTRHLGEVIGLGPGDRVLDVACGAQAASAVHL
jgi:hypothetical protein